MNPSFALHRLLPYAPVVLTLLALDFLAPLIVRTLADASENLAMGAMWLAVGGFLGQGLLLAIWAALGPEPWWARLPSILVAAVALLGAGTLGMLIAIGKFDAPNEAALLVPMLPMWLAAAQIPAWGVRLLFGARIEFPGAVGQMTLPPPRQFRIQHLLATMGCVAFVLGAARWSASWTGMQTTEGWGAAAIGCSVIFLFSAVYTLPAIWIGLGAGNPWTAGLMTFAAVMVFGVAFAGIAGLGGGVRVFLPTLSLFIAFHGGLFAAVLGSLLPFRAYGFILRRLYARPTVKQSSG